MGSVNPNVPVTLPAPAPAPTTTDARQPAADGGSATWGLADGIGAMASDIGSTVNDSVAFAGAKTDSDGRVKAGVDPLGLLGFAGATVGPTALLATRNPVNLVTGVATPYGERFGTTALTGGIRITPTLVSAILGPAIADGVTMIAPNLVKKYKDTKDIQDLVAKKKVEKDNQNAKISRAVAGGVVVGLAAGAVFLLRPEVFKKFGEGVSRAIEGATTFTADGKLTRLTGVLDEAGITAAMAAKGTPLVDGAAVNVVKTIAPMAKDAAFSNRILLGTAGGIGTLLLANNAAGQTDPDRKKLMWGLTAAASAATIGGAYGIGKLTQHSMLANEGAGGLLAKNQLLMKPNIEWIKKYASVIAPITAVPAGTAASQYFNIVNDFDDITSPRSPFRK